MDLERDIGSAIQILVVFFAVMLLLRLLGWRPQRATPQQAIRNVAFGVGLFGLMYVASAIFGPEVAVLLSLALVAIVLAFMALRRMAAGPKDRR